MGWERQIEGHTHTHTERERERDRDTLNHHHPLFYLHIPSTLSAYILSTLCTTVWCIPAPHPWIGSCLPRFSFISRSSLSLSPSLSPYTSALLSTFYSALLPDYAQTGILQYLKMSSQEDQSSTNYKEAFSLFDKRGTGKVSLESLGDLLRACGQNPTLSEISDLEKSIGGDCTCIPVALLGDPS